MTSTGTPIARAAGFIAGDRPADRHVALRRTRTPTRSTRYLATGGYEGLKAALAKTPAGRPRRGARRHRARPRRRRLPGRREVGPHPAGRVAALPRRQRRRERAGHVQGPPPDGARPAPAHRGLPHRVLRRRACRSASSTSAARWPSPRSAWPTALNEAYAAGYVGKNILGTDFSVDIVHARGAPAPTSSARRRRSSRASRATAGMPRLKPPFFPAAIGLYGQPTIVNNVETLANLPWLLRQRRRRLHHDRHRDVARHAHGRRVRPRQAARRVRDRQRHHDVPRPDLRRGVLPGHPRRQRAQGVRARRRVGAVVHARAARPAVRGPARRRRRLDARLRGDHGDGLDHRHPARPRCRSPASTPTSRAASACRAARAARGSSGSSTRICDGHGAPEDLDLLYGVGESICPGASRTRRAPRSASRPCRSRTR